MSIRIEQLGSGDVDAARALLTKDVASNLYLLGLLEEYGVAPQGELQGGFFGHFVAGELTALLFMGGSGALVVPCAGPTADVTALAEPFAAKVQLRAALGERSAVDALLRAWGVRPETVRDQHLFSVSADDLGPFTNPTLRLAREDELDRVLPLAAAALQEALGRDPLMDDPDAFRTRVDRRIKAKRTYVLEVDGALVFKLDIGTRCQYGAELEGMYTVPGHRQLGHATLSLGQISRHLLSSLPRLVLRVGDQSSSLQRMARKVGFVSGKAVRTVLVDESHR